MRDRSNPRFSPEATTLERRELLTGVVKVPFSTFPNPTLNNQGVLVGVMPVTFGTTESESSFVLQPGPNAKPIPIPVLPGDTTTQANALNDAGQVIGISSSNAPNGPSSQRAFLYSPKSGTVMIPTLPGYDVSNPTLLSKGGIVAGSDIKSSSGWDALASSRGFLYSKHRGLVDLGTLPGQSFLLPTAINDQAGLVVGAAARAMDPNSSSPPILHTFSYNIARRKLTDLGMPPGFDHFHPQFVDARGVIAGTATTAYTDGFASGHVFTLGAGTGWKDIGLMPGFDRIALINQMDDGRLLVQVANSTTKATHAAIYQAGKGFRDIAALPTIPSIGDNGGGSTTLGPANKHGLAIVTSSDPQGVFRFQVLNLKTNALTDITSQISDSQMVISGNPVAINDRDQFLVAFGVPDGWGDSAEYLVSLDSRGKPAHITIQPLGAPGPLPPGGVTAMPIPGTATVTQVPIPSGPVFIPPPGAVAATPMMVTPTVLHVPIPSGPVSPMPVGNP